MTHNAWISKMMIAKNILLGLFVIVYGWIIISGLLAGFYFPLDMGATGAIAQAIDSDKPEVSLGTKIFISVVFLWLVVFFVLETMTSKIRNTWDSILHLILGLEMSFYGAIALLQGGSGWLSIFIIMGLIAFLTSYYRLSNRKVENG